MEFYFKQMLSGKFPEPAAGHVLFRLFWLRSQTQEPFLNSGGKTAPSCRTCSPRLVFFFFFLMLDQLEKLINGDEDIPYFVSRVFVSS